MEYEDLEPTKKARAFLGLMVDFEDLFKRPIDLVTPEAIENEYFLESINRTRTTIFETISVRQAMDIACLTEVSA